MAAEYSASVSQIVSPNMAVSFPDAPVPCNKGLIFHREGTGIFRLASPSTIKSGCLRRRCCCSGYPNADYIVSFHGNVQIPTGGTADTISLAVVIDGDAELSSVMSITPTAVEEPGNVGMAVVVSVPWICRCSSMSIRNISTQNVEVLNGVVTINFAGIR